MQRLGRTAVRFRVAIIIAAVVGFSLAGVVGGGVADSLSNGGFEDPGSESFAAAEYLEEEFGAGAQS